MTFISLSTSFQARNEGRMNDEIGIELGSRWSFLGNLALGPHTSVSANHAAVL